MLTHQPSSPTPTRIGRYTLLEPLGEGGMARVFLAQKDGSTEICVLKRLHGQLESNPLASKRFHREAHIASMLSHRAIARVLDAGIEEESFCIAMELVAGQTLEAALDAVAKQSRTMPLPIALLIASEALSALAYAHELTGEDQKPLNIVHRDLTPRNIMVSYAGLVKIIDFGIARGDVDELKTAPGVLMGTPYYMSPEQARTLPVDRRSDLYTFAAVFFEMLAGRRVVRAKGRAAILAEVATVAAPQLTLLNPSVPRAFDAVLARALEKDVSKRHASARELLDDLLRAGAGARAASIEELGRFLRELFPDAEAHAAAQIARVRTSGSSELGAVEETKVERPYDSLPPSTVITQPSVSRKPRSSNALLAMGAGVVLPVAIAAVYFAVVSNAEPERIVSVASPIVVAEPSLPRVKQKEQPPELQEPRTDQPKTERPRTAQPKIEQKTAQPIDQPKLERPKIEQPKTEPKTESKTEQPKAEQPKAEQPKAELAKADPPKRTAELERMLDKLRASPKDATLRATLLDRIEADAAKLPPQQQRKIKAAIDPARFDEDVSGIARGIAELEKALATLPGS